MKQKWIEIFRQSLLKAGLDEANYSDEEVVKISKGFYSPELSKEAEITRQWVFELYWQALLTMNPHELISEGEGFVDMNIFEQRVKNNQN